MAKVSKKRRRIGLDENGEPVYKTLGWWVRFVDPDGNERASRTFRTKGEAEDFALGVEHNKRTGFYVDPKLGRLTFREYAEEWRASRPHRGTTAAQCESRLRLHVYPFIGSRPLQAIRPSEVQAMITNRADVLAASSLENVALWVRTIFRAAVDDRLITVSPAAKLALPARPHRAPAEAMNLAYVDKLASNLPARLSATVAVGVGAGLRAGEVLGLTLDRVDFLRRELRVDRQLVTPQKGQPFLGPPKTRAGVRTIPLPDLVVEALAVHVASHPPKQVELVERSARGDSTVEVKLLFTSSTGRPLRRGHWGETWASAWTAAGLEGRAEFHRLRHTYASMLIAAGCSVKVVQARLGHATAQETLDTYGHMWPGDDDRTRKAVDETFAAWRADSRSDQDRTNGEAHAL